MHGGFVALFAVLGLVVAGSAGEALLGGDAASGKWKMAARYGWLTSGCLVASLLNPQGAKLHLHIIELLQVSWYKTHINEYQSPSFTSEPMFFYMALLFLGLMAAYSLLRQKRITESLWILFFAYWSLVSARNIPLFIIVVLPWIALELTSLWRELAEGSSRQSTVGVLDDIAVQTSGRFRPFGLWTPLFLVAILWFTPRNRWPTDFSTETFPLAMLHRHAGELAQARTFTLDQWADYLIYENYPRQRVFIDGRSDYYGEDIGKAYLAMLDAEPNWRELLAQYRFDRVLCPPDVPLAALLKNNPDWRTEDQDKESILFARN
jgi:hypothetical protein